MIIDDPDHWYEERAAIMQYCGEMPRKVAESLAMRQLIWRIIEQWEGEFTARQVWDKMPTSADMYYANRWIKTFVDEGLLIVAGGKGHGRDPKRYRVKP